uniref:Uncharacterized protein n=1 Tax=Rangifer tarandus platyrhynchus TaxID=3082113 RepID=A0ACB0ECM2_RANTA|nr:unnamed protein product [Rangifer tarandus platyrhynchus]
MAGWLRELGSRNAGFWKLTRPVAPALHVATLSGYLRLSAASFARLRGKPFRGHAESTASSARPSPQAASHARRRVVWGTLSSSPPVRHLSRGLLGVFPAALSPTT